MSRLTRLSEPVKVRIESEKVNDEVLYNFRYLDDTFDLNRGGKMGLLTNQLVRMRDAFMDSSSSHPPQQQQLQQACCRSQLLRSAAATDELERSTFITKQLELPFTVEENRWLKRQLHQFQEAFSQVSHFIIPE